jgi:hypothetical protein
MNNPIFKTREELLTFIPQNTIGAEIGIFEGEYSKLILRTIKPKKFYMVDVFTGPVLSGDKNGENIKTINLDETYKSLLKEYENKEEVNVYKGKSEDFFKTIPDDYLDFIYIDGDHGYEGAKLDLQNSFNKVKSGGLICGHDYAPMFQGVINAVNEFVTTNKLSLVLTTEDKCASYFIINQK